jgi:hypothetical protein
MGTFKYKSECIVGLALMVLLAAGAAAAEAAPSLLCQVDEKGNAVVRSEVLSVDPLLEKDFRSILDSTNALAKKIAPLVRPVTRKTYALETFNRQIDELPSELDQLRKKIEQILPRLPGLFRQPTREIITQYFRLVAVVIQTQALNDPRAFTLSDFLAKYSISINARVKETIFPSGEDIELGFEVTPERLSPLPEKTFQALVRAAALSPKTGDLSRRYLEASRCLLGYTILSKYVTHQSLLGSELTDSPLPGRQLLCLNTTAEEIRQVAKKASSSALDVNLKTQVLGHLPQSLDALTPALKKLIVEFDLTEYLGHLYTEPRSLAILNQYPDRIKQEKIVPEEKLNAILEGIEKSITGQYEKFPALQGFRNLWANAELQSQLKQFLGGCKFQVADAIDESWLTMMQRSEDFHFLLNLKVRFLSSSDIWIETDVKRLTKLILDFVISERLAAAHRALMSFVASYADSSTPKPNEMVSALSLKLDSLIVNEIVRLGRASGVEKWAADFAQKIIASRGQVSSTELANFAGELKTQSLEVKPFLNPARLVVSLPFEPKVVLKSLSPLVMSLSQLNQKQLDILMEEKEGPPRRALWENIKDQLTRSKSPDAKNFAVLVAALGLQLDKSPKNMGVTLHALGASSPADQVEQFENTYRENLINSRLVDYRILTMPIGDSQEKHLRLVDILSSASADTALHYIRFGLKRSLEDLTLEAQQVAQAQSIESLEPFIMRSTLINSLLGQGQLGKLAKAMTPGPGKAGELVSLTDLGLVFPDLIDFHLQLKAGWHEDRRLGFEIWDDFVRANSSIVLATFLGGMIVPRLLARLPLGPYLSLIPSRLNLYYQRASPVIQGQSSLLYWLFLTRAVGRQIQRQDLTRGTDELEQLMKTDILKPGTAINPLPMVTWNDYIQQRSQFKTALELTDSQQLQMGIWSLLPFVVAGSTKFIGGRVGKAAQAKQARLENMMTSPGQFSEMRLQTRINAKLRLLADDLRVLKWPSAIEPHELKMKYDIAIAGRKTLLGEYRVKEAYQRIILEFGEDLIGLQGKSALLDQYARALYGQRGSSATLIRLLQEYNRLLEHGI